MSDEYDPYTPRGSARERPGAQLRDDDGDMSGPQAVAVGQLRAFIERVESVQEDIDALSDDKKQIFAEAKAMGFDNKALRAIIRMRKMDDAKRQEAEAILDLYKSALGMV